MSRRTTVETGTNGEHAPPLSTKTSEGTPLLEGGDNGDANGHYTRVARHHPQAEQSYETCDWGSCCCWYALIRCCGFERMWRRYLYRARDKENLSIYNIQSLAILMSYFSVGVALELLATPVAYYLIDTLGAESGVYTVWYILVSLPWSFKVLYGFLSDCVPLGGLKRKPYMYIGWMIHIVSNAILAIMVTPGTEWTIILSFVGACGYLLSDVMTDAIVVEKTQKESMSKMGNIQASGYIARYFGSALGAIGGAVLYNKDTWGWGLSISTLFWINGLVPLFLVLPLMPFLIEQPKVKDKLKKHTDELWTLVQKKSVWRPMSFVYIYNVLMIPNGAWTNYLVETLDFSDWDIGVVNIFSQVAAWLGLVAYKYWMADMSWPMVYAVTTFIAFITSIMQLLLILGVSSSWGIPDLLFASGDEAAYNLILALQFLPVTRMYAVMCPPGSEGTSYALLTTMSNVAYSVAYSIGDLLTGLGGNWDVSNASLAAGDMSGMWRLTVLTSCIAVSPIVLVWLLPANKKEQQELQKSSDTSRLGGQIFVAVAAGSILFSIGQAIYELIFDV